MTHNIYPFTEAALAFACQRAQWAAIRYSSETTSTRVVRNDVPERNETHEDAGAMCEVLVDGQFGYCATANTSLLGLQAAFERAIATTRVTAAYQVHAFTTAQRPAAVGHYASPRTKPLRTTALAEVLDCLRSASAAMRGDERIVNRNAQAMLIQTELAYFSSTGAAIVQGFDMVNIELSATAAKGVQSQTRSWSHTGQLGGEAFDRPRWVAEAQRVAAEAVELLESENCPTGRMDLVLMPDQMMLQIHESIGHPLELDRILGDERNYAGWSFVKPADFGNLRYGSDLMNVSFDPGLPHEFASYAFDDGGNPAKRELLIENGILRRGLGALESQLRSGLPGVANFRSASWNRAPIDRMANLNLEPGQSSLEELISQVENGVLMHTNRSWSIDDYRNKFQFGCEYGQRIRNGQLQGTVRNPNYRGITVDFWSRLAGVGREQLAYGTPYCGKGEPSQAIRVGHASPPCLFKDVEVFGGAE